MSCNRNRDYEEIKKEEVTEPFVIEPAKDEKKPGFWRRNGAKIIAVTYYTTMAALVIGGIIKGAKNQKTFDRLIKEKYGENHTEGCFAEGNLKKLWDGNRAFEESYKGNFDKVADFVKGLDMRADETYSIDRVVDKTGKLVTELVQVRDGGYYHGVTL